MHRLLQTTILLGLSAAVIGTSGLSPAITSAAGSAASSVDSCAVQITGDVNVDGRITAADIICIVSFVFLGPCQPQPCRAAADVQCTGTVTTSDIIWLVNYVFKGGAAPCDVCTIVPDKWSCP